MTSEELRTMARNGYHPTKPVRWADAMLEAADDLDRLTARVAELEQAIGSCDGTCGSAYRSTK